jgi:hypothetical protein
MLYLEVMACVCLAICYPKETSGMEWREDGNVLQKEELAKSVTEKTTEGLAWGMRQKDRASPDTYDGIV